MQSSCQKSKQVVGICSAPYVKTEDGIVGAECVSWSKMLRQLFATIVQCLLVYTATCIMPSPRLRLRRDPTEQLSRVGLSRVAVARMNCTLCTASHK